MLEELVANRDEDATSGLSVIDTVEAVAVNIDLGEVAVDLVAEQLDTGIDLVVDKDNACADSDMEDNEVDMRSGFRIASFFISSLIIILLLIIESLHATQVNSRWRMSRRIGKGEVRRLLMLMRLFLNTRHHIS